MARHAATPTARTTLHNAQAEYTEAVIVAKAIAAKTDMDWVQMTEPEWNAVSAAVLLRRAERNEEDAMNEALDARDADLLEGN